MAFRLVIEQGKGQGQSFDFEVERITIGRTQDNDMILTDNGISRQHACIEQMGARYVVRDLKSANGILVNQERIQEDAILSTGDLIAIGGAILQFEDLSVDSSSTQMTSLDSFGDLSGLEDPGDVGSGEATQIGKIPVQMPASSFKKPVTMGAQSTTDEAAKKKKMMMMAGGGVGLLLVILIVAMSMKTEAKQGGECPNVLFIGDRDVSFGSSSDSVCYAASTIQFDIPLKKNAITYFNYSTTNTSDGDVELYFNDKKLTDVAGNPGKTAPTYQSVILPEEDFVDEGYNTVTFKHVNGEVWAVQNVSLDQFDKKEADAVKASNSYLLATKLYQNKTVAARNLYDAFVEMKNARLYMEGLAIKPDIYQQALDLLRDIQKEMDQQCSQYMFKGKREFSYGNHQKSNQIFKFVLAAFPGDAHYCNARAKAFLTTE